MTNPKIETPFASDPFDYKLSQDPDGTRHGINPRNSLTILPDGETRLFQRRAIKGVGGENVTFDSCLVGELNGVRVYVKDNSIVLTTQDLML